MPNKYDRFAEEHDAFLARATGMLSEMRQTKARYDRGWALYIGDRQWYQELQKSAIARQHNFDLIEARGAEALKNWTSPTGGPLMTAWM